MRTLAGPALNVSAPSAALQAADMDGQLADSVHRNTLTATRISIITRQRSKNCRIALLRSAGAMAVEQPGRAGCDSGSAAVPEVPARPTSGHGLRASLDAAAGGVATPCSLHSVHSFQSEKQMDAGPEGGPLLPQVRRELAR